MDNFCNNANTKVEVYTFDSALNPVEADITFECFNELCSMGKTKIGENDAVLIRDFPQCVNGIVKAKVEGYVTSEQIISTNEEAVSNLILNKLYDLPLDVSVGGIPLTSGVAVIDFVSENYKTTIVYPEQKTISLSEGLYNVSARVFSGSSLTIPGSSSSECVEVPKKGLLGFFGGTDEECFEVELPPQTLDNALSGGGGSVELILESDLRLANGIKLDVPVLPSPLTLDQLQQNYELINGQRIGVIIT